MKQVSLRSQLNIGAIDRQIFNRVEKQLCWTLRNQLKTQLHVPMWLQIGNQLNSQLDIQLRRRL